MNINLVCGCCLAGDGDVTRTQEILCYPPCVLCPVYLVSAGIFITREDSVRYCHKLHRTPTIDDALVCAHIVCSLKRVQGNPIFTRGRARALAAVISALLTIN